MALALIPTPPKTLPTSIPSTSTCSVPAPFPSCHHLLFLVKDCKTMTQLKQIHAQTLKTSSPSSSTLSYHTLFLYSRILRFSTLHDLHYASRLFNAIQNPNSFIFNTLIRAYASSSHHKSHSLLLYHRMLSQSIVSPDKYTFPFVLKACAFLFAISEGMQIHARILKLGFGSDAHVNNSLIHFYATCGYLDIARKVFDEMPQRTVVSWNVVIDGYVCWGEFETALGLFKEMVGKSFEPDKFTMQSVVSACAGLGALSLGLWSHVYVLRKFSREVADDVLMNNSLLDMYCKCGSLCVACQLFEKMPKRDVTSWNAMILGFAIHGCVDKALDALDRMCTVECLRPNSITFVGVLSAFNHRGLVREGRMYFDLMVSKYKIQPRIEHYGCLVDLLARAGFIEEALDVVSEMPMKPDVVIWRSLLDACCRKNGGIEVSELVARRIFELDEGEGMSSGAYVLMSRVYASANRWEDVGLVRRLMGERGIRKEPGCSSIEIDGFVHEFVAGDTSHVHSKEIYEALGEIEERIALMGYRPELSQAPLVAELNGEKENSLRLHSERLAIAFGLLNARPGAPIRILKNLRVCDDCHTVTKLISSVFGVEIIVRDRTRFHRFKDGLCSCMDYW
ncbi:tetratricopeptide repeat (TPR)-like superfamily protein [Tasmannia lanceolata]|uniref:tetratricopeptide repeat (TPR)-like superfamily protein n=1 Tax=Tasmannia lanceolata TaxID=3420 RepID=UPI0040635547